MKSKQAQTASQPAPQTSSSEQNPAAEEASAFHNPNVESEHSNTTAVEEENGVGEGEIKTSQAAKDPVPPVTPAALRPLTNLSRHFITNEMVFGPIPDREYHAGFMRKAIEMAQLALDSDETPVGCVFVRDGEVIGRGINGTNASLNVSHLYLHSFLMCEIFILILLQKGTRHAEFVALCEIMSRHHPSILHTTDLYVTVEPCVMCASALRQFGIRTVYFGCLNDRFGGTGGVMTIHMDEGVDPPFPVYGGLFREEAIMLLRRFYVQENDKGMFELRSYVCCGMLTFHSAAPEPKPKKNRELKTEILPIGVPSGGNTPANVVSPALATPLVGTPTTEAPDG